MNIRTVEENFEYQANEIFKSMHSDYKDEQKSNIECEEDTQTFAEWLWDNKADLGEAFYTALDEWCGIDEFTEELNIK